MTLISRMNITNGAALAVSLVVGSVAGLYALVSDAATLAQPVPADSVPREPSNDLGTTVHLDRSGRKQVGTASFYAARYSGKKMADGTPMKLYSNNAASLTLPLGTTAKVTNLATGKSALVTIRDRGPYVKGRIVDLSPATATLIGLSKKKGLAPVEVTPISFPDAGGNGRLASLHSR